MPGTLWLVGTPIGNLGDVTERAGEVLSRVDIVACEDTRRTRGLLSHLGIEGRTLVSFFEGNEERRTEELLEHLRDGRDVAVVSDAGMPGLSDPGYRLVAACAAEGIAVDAAPGPSAAITALVLSGLPTNRFAFEGFLPRKPGARRARLRELADEPRTVVAFESPRRLRSMLADAAAALGADRPAAVARELTKLHQEVTRGTLGELAQRVGEVRGEAVVVIGGAPGRPPPELSDLVERVDWLMTGGVPRREASARVADEAGVSRRDVYEASLRNRPT